MGFLRNLLKAFRHVPNAALAGQRDAALDHSVRTQEPATQPGSDPTEDTPRVFGSDWYLRGMCPRCREWVYVGEGIENPRHCGMSLVNLGFKADIDAEDARREEAERTSHDKLVSDFVDAVLSFTQEHLPTLSRKYRETHVLDDYGVEQDIGWDREVGYFIENVLRLNPSAKETIARAADLVTQAVQAEIMEDPLGPLSDEAPEDPLAYERYCAQLLSTHGWSTRTTQATCDQGVDIVAERDGLRVALQCKLYSRPVGNGAVQEIIAGTAYVGAAVGCVVSNNTYTPAARRLAASAAVVLLHHSELGRLADLAPAVRKQQ